ncbi:MAG: ClbS/DfsB family four-helix bundle protein [Chloroflexi bacterium]|nr:ClbS/DfsB family four-helix bundle protein [Chloroflexota bacterium]MBU1750763.1 ClbS/DfsB family four-helix bundle protein [Chloroflexota bacterium]
MRSTAEEKKSQLITEFVETRRAILDAAAALPPTAQDEVFLGVWSVKDLLAHLAGWDVSNLEAAKAVLAGELPAFYAHHDRDWQTYNARLVAEHRRGDFGELVASVVGSHRQLVEFLETIPAQELFQDQGVRFRGYKVTVARLIEADVKDVKIHHAQIIEFRDGKN